MENQGKCSEERNPASLKQKRQNPEGGTRRGFALNKNRQSWRIEFWLPERNDQYSYFHVFSFSRR